MRTALGGFSLVELIVVTVLGALIVAAAVQVLAANERTYATQNARIQGQRSTRAALSLLTEELREISPEDGDLLAMGSDSIKLRVMRKFGVTCERIPSGGDLVLALLPVGAPFMPADSVKVFLDGDPTTGDDDQWVAARVERVDTTSTCGAGEAQAVHLGLGEPPEGALDGLRAGAPVRSYVTLAYELAATSDGAYLARRFADGTRVRLVGPLKAGDGLEFDYLDAEGRATTVPGHVRQISVTLRTRSGGTEAGADTVSDSITALVHPRN